MKKGDWVAQVGVKQPLFGVVVGTFEDDGEYLLNIKLYDLQGNDVGRKSPRMGGPAGFEPACPAQHWRKIKPPQFPIDRVGLYGEYDHLLEPA